jgi:hypothetical protein
LKACIAVLGPSTESGATCKATIHGTSEEIGMALVIMGKQIAQQQVPNPQRALKLAKRPTPTTKSTTAPPTMSTTAGRPEPTGRKSPNYAGALQDTFWLVEEIWATPPHLHHCMNPPGARDSEPAAHRRGAVPQQPASTTAQASMPRRPRLGLGHCAEEGGRWAPQNG